jgi:hypothetical protein
MPQLIYSNKEDGAGNKSMKKKLLYLPVLLIGLPILGALLVTAGQFDVGAGQRDSGLQDEMKNLDQELGQRANPLPDAAGMEQLARQDPVAFLENCIRYYDRNVQGYRLIMYKQERLPKKDPIEKRKLQNKEVIEVCFKEKPSFSVYMHWLEGARKADKALYVDGENDNQILVHPAGWAGKLVKVVRKKVDGPEAQESGRYTLDQSGIKNGTLRTLTFMKAAQKRGKLDMDYFGADGQWHPCKADPNDTSAAKLGRKLVSGAGGRSCYVLRRHYDQEENDGVWELTFFVDPSNWLQVGSIVEGKTELSTGERYLIGEYYFRDINLNPTFGADQFKEAAVVPK